MNRLRNACAVAVLGLSLNAFAGPTPPLRPVDMGSVTIDDAFWTPKRDFWQQKTINDCFDKFEKSGALANFDLVRDGKTTGHRGEPWYDGLVYEMIAASSDFLRTKPDPVLRTRVDGYIDRITAAAARDRDGYLNTYTQLKEPDHRWGTNGGNDRWQHDLYNAGCLVEAAVHDYRATGNVKLLTAAVRLANHMADLMGPPPKRNIIPGHAIAEQSFFELAELLKAEAALKDRVAMAGDPARFAALAQFWIDARGHHEGRTNTGAYNQDDVPVSRQQTLEGHAVRATLLCTSVATIAAATGRDDYRQTAERLWRNMTDRRTYLTGGIGASAEDEKFGADYQLPNTGYAETCAAVSKSLFDYRMNLLTGNARCVDGLEQSLYNGVLSGVSVSGDHYFYENPLQADPKRNRWTWHDCPCCPPMFLKLVGGLPGYLYAQDDHSVYVNLFVGSHAAIKIGNTPVVITQTTKYPWEGAVKINVDPASPSEFDVSVRVPGWCVEQPADALYRDATPATSERFTLSINGEVAQTQVQNGYARVRRQWKKGDTIDVRVDVSPRYVVANPAVEADRGRVALMAGPIVYCLESTDQNVPLGGLSLPIGRGLHATYRADLLGGVTVLQGPAVSTVDPAKSTEFIAIPFFATANRGPREMTVWPNAAN